ncbi:MAG TPA: Smr/MutS family protein [Polyangiaceae bacterium]|nr:Smr/MutS family protein [Polyangiaceae bacterium]
MHIEDSIDLHGFAPRDVLSVVEEYLEAAARAGFEEVRLVHGRGKGVQRRSVQELLATHPLVLGYRDAPPTRGGLGATLVWLRRVDATGRTRWLWRIPRSGGEREWRALLAVALARTDRVCWSARAHGRLAFDARFPFVHWKRDRQSDEDRCWALAPEARAFIDEWDPTRGLPEKLTLLEGASPVLVASSDGREVAVYLDDEERERLRDVELVPT